MPPIPDELLYQHAERVRNKVVFITGMFLALCLLTSALISTSVGAATGIGKVTATRFAAYGYVWRQLALWLLYSSHA